MALFACALMMAGSASAESPGRLVSKGNKQYDKKDFAKALDLYDRASVKAPESPIVAFNKGDAFFKKGDLDKAREQFQQAASKTKSLPFESKAWYNLGNCAFEEGKRQEDSDLGKALESLQESVKRYGTALEKDPGNKPAAENMEIARLKIKDLLDKQKKQQQQGGKQGDQQKQQGDQKGQSGDKQQQGKQEEKAQAQQQPNKEQPKQDEKNKQGSPKEQPKKQLARDATAREILDQEKKDRKDQQVENAGGYHPVDKDW
jgi:tetratricopeptide (TPR) repeat protein